jgi:hypothetical protein
MEIGLEIFPLYVSPSANATALEVVPKFGSREN